MKSLIFFCNSLILLSALQASELKKGGVAGNTSLAVPAHPVEMLKDNSVKPSVQNNPSVTTGVSTESTLTTPSPSSEKAVVESAIPAAPVTPVLTVSEETRPLSKPAEKCPPSHRGIILDAKFSYFYPWSHLFRDVFGGGINYELSLTAPVWKDLNIWAAVDYFDQWGHSKGGHQRTYIRIVPLTLGLKYIYPLQTVSLYGGLGFRYFFVHTKNHSHYVDRTVNRSGLGGVAELGLLYFLTEHFLLDFFTNFSFKELDAPHPHHDAVYKEDFQVGGWNTGIGLGYKF